jgi:hypothetical protein
MKQIYISSNNLQQTEVSHQLKCPLCSVVNDINETNTDGDILTNFLITSANAKAETCANCDKVKYNNNK